jgi:hypothetical protein
MLFSILNHDLRSLILEDLPRSDKSCPLGLVHDLQIDLDESIGHVGAWVHMKALLSKQLLADWIFFVQLRQQQVLNAKSRRTLSFPQDF